MRILAVIVAFILDLIFGDPQNQWHPICNIGNFIAKQDKMLRSKAGNDEKKQFINGIYLWVIVCFTTFIVTFAILFLAKKLNIYLWFVLETFLCYKIFACKCLKDESIKVYKKLKENDLQGARVQISYLVGRDTNELTHEGVTKATVETVAENTADGVIAPMIYMIIGGAPLGMLYKAVNTLDSMVGYKNDKYLFFGRVSAKIDDVFNYIPSRFSAVCMIVASEILKFNAKNAFYIWKRDRRNHTSPNSAQTESVCAGALDIQLAGNAYYFGKLYTKPTIGDKNRDIQDDDIVKTCKIMVCASVVSLVLLSVLAFIF